MSLYAENVALVEMVFGQIANGQTNDAAQITHLFGCEEVMEGELESPENRGGGQAHGSVERKSLGVMDCVVRAKAKDVAFVEKILDEKSSSCADGNGDEHAECSVVKADGEVLCADVRCGCHAGKNAILERQSCGREH